MKGFIAFLLSFALLISAVPPCYAAPANEVAPGTEVHLTLLDSINSRSAQDGDAFVAVLAKPVMLGDQTLLPAGTRLHGVVGTTQKAKMFSMFRGQAFMSISFKTIEVDSRLIPVTLSILAIGQPRVDAYSKERKDVKIVEGEMIQEKHDLQGDMFGTLLPGSVGTLAGFLAGSVAMGTGIGLAAGAAYVCVRKGKEVKLPAETGILARLDSPIAVPNLAAYNGSSANAQ